VHKTKHHFSCTHLFSLELKKEARNQHTNDNSTVRHELTRDVVGLFNEGVSKHCGESDDTQCLYTGNDFTKSGA
jgi:hypothetical protein